MHSKKSGRRRRSADRGPRIEGGDHICARQAICFQCFRAGIERARARRQAWSQRSLPFEGAVPQLTPREIAHRQRMLAHLAEIARRA
jgi:hypothetical protein